MTEVFTSRRESSRVVLSGEEPTGISADPRRDRLLKNYLFASDNAAAADALNRLTVDGSRAAIGGMTPRERGLAEGIDTAREWAPVVAANVGVAGAAGAISFSSPEARPLLVGGFAVGGVAGVGIEVVANILSKMEKRFPKTAELAKRIAAKHVGKWMTMLSVSGLLGTAVGGIIDAHLMARAAAEMGQPDVGLYGHQANPPAGISESAWQARRDAIQSLSEIHPPVETVVPHLPEVPVDSGEAQLQAAEAQEAARQAAELQAATPVGLTGQELAGGTIWGNELEFVRQEGIYHIEPATNLLKEFAKLLAQPQPPTEIGPSDTAYMVNRDVARWAVKQLDTLYRMDPSAMESWQKALWEIGRGLRSAGWQDLQAVTEEFVKQARP